MRKGGKIDRKNEEMEIKRRGFGRRFSHARSYPGIRAGWPKNMYPTGSLCRDTGKDIVHGILTHTWNFDTYMYMCMCIRHWYEPYTC